MIEDCTKPDGGYVEISGFVDGVLPSSDNWIIRDDEPMPDGRIDGGMFRPLMIECPNQSWVDSHQDCLACDTSGEVRNPALEWGRRCREFGQLWWTNTDHKGVRNCTNPSGQVHKLCDWVALGVTP